LTQLCRIAACSTTLPPISPLMLSDHLLRLADEADDAGFRGTAEYLLELASEVLDEPGGGADLHGLMAAGLTLP
jgi:hypothetical protein